MEFVNDFQVEGFYDEGYDEWYCTVQMNMKPNPQIFMNALKKLNVKPSESVFIGDHPENDVKAAQNVGMKGIWKKDDQWTGIEADAIIDDYLELPMILKNLRSSIHS